MLSVKPSGAGAEPGLQKPCGAAAPPAPALTPRPGSSLGCRLCFPLPASFPGIGLNPVAGPSCHLSRGAQSWQLPPEYLRDTGICTCYHTLTHTQTHTRVRTHKHAHTSVLHPQADNDRSRQQDQGLALSPGLAERRQAGLHPSLMALLPSPRSSSFPFAL